MAILRAKSNRGQAMRVKAARLKPSKFNLGNIIPNKIKIWWNERNFREQALFLIFSIFAAGAGLYKTVVEPFTNEYLQAKSRYAETDRDYRLLQDKEDLLNKARAQSGGALLIATSIQELKKIVDNSSSKEKLQLNSSIVKQGDIDVIEIEFDGIAGARLMSWLEDLIRQGIKVIEIDASNNGGRLYGKFVLGG